MRVYPLLLGILLTTGYGYAAQIAVSSLGAGRVAPADPSATIPAPASEALDGVWYGGVLDPVTVETYGGTRAAAGKTRVLTRPTVRCVEAGRSTYRAVS